MDVEFCQQLFLCLLRLVIWFLSFNLFIQYFHIDWFADIKPPFCSWDKSQLVVVYDSFNALLNTVCLYFVDDFCIYVWSVISACNFLFCNTFVYFWYQGNPGLIEWVQKCSFFFNFLNSLRKICVNLPLNIWWTKVSTEELMLLNCGVGEDSWESLDCKEIKPVNPKGNQSWLHWKDSFWSWSYNTLATWCKELTHWRRPWFWERLKTGGEGDIREWDSWIASLTLCTWVWASSGSWWQTGKPGMLQSMGLQSRTRLSNWIDLKVQTGVKLSGPELMFSGSFLLLI